MNFLKQLRLLIPLFIFFIIVIVLWRGLTLHPAEIPSPLINKPAPEFQLPTLLGTKKIMTEKDFLGQVTLLNVWATWCEACAEEHALLLHLAKDEQVNFYGLNYKDDVDAAKKWLADYGNPYKIIAVDQDGKTAIEWGVYGTPETFVIDKHGIIRYKQIGSITVENWARDLKPMVEKLQQEN